MKKYRLTENTIEYEGRTLYQIEALETIYPYEDDDGGCYWDPPIADKGDLGGYVETEKNLSHLGCCWITDNAKVFGNAEILDDAQVSGNAIISDNAIICNDASISGNAIVKDDSIVDHNAHVLEYAVVSGDSHISSNSYVLSESKVLSSYIKDSNIFDNAIIDNSGVTNSCIGKHACVTSWKDIISISYWGCLNIKLTAYKTEDNVYIANERYRNHHRILESESFLKFTYNFGKDVLDEKLEYTNLSIMDLLDKINLVVSSGLCIKSKVISNYLMTVYLSFSEVLKDKKYRN